VNFLDKPTHVINMVYLYMDHHCQNLLTILRYYYFTGGSFHKDGQHVHIPPDRLCNNRPALAKHSLISIA